MTTTRRGFLGTLGAALAGALVAPDELWLPSAKKIFLPPKRGWIPPTNICDDFTIDRLGNIRYVGKGARYTVVELHRYLQEAFEQPDLIDNPTPSDRVTDNLICLNGSFNIDDHAAEYLYDGSIGQRGGKEIYAGMHLVGWADEDTQIVAECAGKEIVLPRTNNRSPNVLSQCLLKTPVRDDGQIEGIVVKAKYSRDFIVQYPTKGLNVAAICEITPV